MSTKTINQPAVDIVLPANTNIFLTIFIGYAQMGASQVQFAGDPAPIAKGTITHLALGNSNSLKGKTLEILSKVLESNTATMNYIVTHDFSDGTPAHFTTSGAFAASGDILIWNTTYNFK